jgi:hypothetical protein
MNGDGIWVSFVSSAMNLVPGATNAPGGRGVVVARWHGSGPRLCASGMASGASTTKPARARVEPNAWYLSPTSSEQIPPTFPPAASGVAGRWAIARERRERRLLRSRTPRRPTQKG